MDTDTKLDMKSYRMILLLSFVMFTIVGCSSSDDTVPREPHIAQAYIHFCLSDDFDCNYPLPLRVLTIGSDISLGGTVFARLFNGVVTGTGGCFDPDGYPLWAPPQTTITWSNITTGDHGYGWTYWKSTSFGVCRSFWEVDNIPLAWGDNELVFIGTSEGDDGRSAEIQATVTRRPEQPKDFEYEALEGKHTFKWTEDLPGAASFNLYYSTTPNFTSDFPVYVNDDNLIHVSDINSPYVLTGLEENVIYYFAIAGVTDNGVIGVLSDEQSLITYKPEVLSTLPATSATDVELNTTITVIFNKDISSTSVNSSTFSLYDNRGLAVPASVSVIGNTATLTPASQLLSDKVYSVTISGKVEDLYNNTLGAEHKWSFKTVDILAPTILSYRPGALEKDVLRNSVITITFDEPINCSTINNNSIALNPFTAGVVTCDSEVIAFTPSISLDPNTAYSVTISAGIRDLAGNPILTDFSWSYTTGTDVAWAHTFQSDRYWVSSWDTKSNSTMMGNIIETSDSGYMIVGSTEAIDLQNETTYGYWSMKLDSEGRKERELSGKDMRAYSVAQAPDGGFVLAGVTDEYIDICSPVSHAFIMKLDTDGAPVWQKEYDSPVNNAREFLTSVVPVSTGGYIAAGHWEVDVSDYWCYDPYITNAWVMRVDNSGEILWQKKLKAGYIKSIQESTDGGYIFVGGTRDLYDHSDDLWVVKLDSDGLISWQSSFGKIDFEESGADIEQTSDGGYIVVGNTDSYGSGETDLWILKLNASGTPEWQYVYGGNREDRAAAVRQTADDGYIVAGQTRSFGAGSDDIWLLKLDKNGVSQWQRTYGNFRNQVASSIELTADGGYIIGGESEDNWWALKLGRNGDIQFNTASGYQLNGTSVLPVATTHVPETGTILINDSTQVGIAIDGLFVIGNSTTEQQAP